MIAPAVSVLTDAGVLFARTVGWIVVALVVSTICGIAIGAFFDAGRGDRHGR